MLGDQRDGVAADLQRLALRHWVEDTKEVQANSVAIGGLTTIKGPIAISTMCQILQDAFWDDDE